MMACSSPQKRRLWTEGVMLRLPYEALRHIVMAGDRSGKVY